MINNIFELLTSQKSFFLKLLWEHIFISFMAILLAIILGLIIGIIISERQKHSNWALSFVNFVYTIPSISMLGFLIPLSGIGNKTAIIALTIYALLPMVRNTHTGLTNISPAILEAAKGMGSSDKQILYKIKLPLALPVIMSGVRNTVTMTIALAGIASFIGAGGLGVAIYRGITTNNMALTLIGSLLIAILAVTADLILGMINKRIAERKYKLGYKKLLVGVFAIILITLLPNVIKMQKKTIHIATKPMTEQHIMGEILRFMIEQRTDYDVELVLGVGGGTNNIHPAMLAGEFDLYPEYTGTGWNIVLKNKEIYHEELYSELVKSYEEKFGLTWMGMYGFNNTFGIAVRKDIADKFNLNTYSDLAKVSGDLNFGAEYDFFEREDGYKAMCDVYGLKFNKTVDIDIGLKYQAINNKSLDTMIVFTTDGQLSMADIKVLEDDKSFFPSYKCGNIVSLKALDKYPELEDILKETHNLIDDKTMSDLNYQVESNGKLAKVVAEQFMKSKGIWRDN